MLLAVHKDFIYLVFKVLSGWFHNKCELYLWRTYPCLIDSHEVCGHCMCIGSSSRDPMGGTSKWNCCASWRKVSTSITYFSYSLDYGVSSECGLLWLESRYVDFLCGLFQYSHSRDNIWCSVTYAMQNIQMGSVYAYIFVMFLNFPYF